MVLYPLPAGQRTQCDAPPVSAWQAVEKRQKQAAEKWWLISQADHAALAGDLAVRLNFPPIPGLDAEVIRAIAAHDAGWGQFDDHQLLVTPAVQEKSPISFLDIAPKHFLIAWTGSINAAERFGPVAGVIVSSHFSRLAQARLTSRSDSSEDHFLVQQFLSQELGRQQQLRNHAQRSPKELELLTDVLQFCDLVSLYLCCGADELVEFPQKFGGTTIQVRKQEDAFLFTPPVFGSGTALGVSARQYPGRDVRALPFLLG